MEIDDALDYARRFSRGVLVTMKRDGRPQLSNILYVVGNDGRVRISVTTGRAKARNAARDPRVSLHVTAPDFWSYVVLEGDAELLPAAAAPDDPTVEALVDYYRSANGEHPDWDDYRAAMVRDRRTILSFSPANAYGMPGGG